MINFVKSGDNLTLAAPYDVLSGGGFKVGNVFGVAANATLSGADVECDREGVYDLAKDNSTFSQGDLAYWDDSAKKVTSTVASNLLIGAVEVVAATSVAIVRVNRGQCDQARIFRRAGLDANHKLHGEGPVAPLEAPLDLIAVLRSRAGKEVITPPMAWSPCRSRRHRTASANRRLKWKPKRRRVSM